MSSRGIVPPTIDQRRRRPPRPAAGPRPAGTRVMWAPERIERPTTSASSCTTVAAICSGRLVQSGVDDLHARVAQAAGDDLRPAVVAVEAGLGDDDTDRAVHGRFLRVGRGDEYSTPPGPANSPGGSVSAVPDPGVTRCARTVRKAADAVTARADLLVVCVPRFPAAAHRPGGRRGRRAGRRGGARREGRRDRRARAGSATRFHAGDALRGAARRGGGRGDGHDRRLARGRTRGGRPHRARAHALGRPGAARTTPTAARASARSSRASAPAPTASTASARPIPTPGRPTERLTVHSPVVPRRRRSAGPTASSRRSTARATSPTRRPTTSRRRSWPSTPRRWPTRSPASPARCSGASQPGEARAPGRCSAWPRARPSRPS